MALYAVRFFRPAAYWIQAEMQRYRDTEIQELCRVPQQALRTVHL